MIKKLQLLVFMIISSTVSFAQVGIGTTSPDASAALDLSATDKGFLMPRMTSAQRTAIASPATSLTVFDTDTNTFWSYVASTWIEASGGGKFIDGATPDIAYYPTKVGIGINTFGDPHILFVSGIKDTDGVNTAARINGTYDGTGTSLGTTGSASIARNNGTGTSTWGIGAQAIVQNPIGTITNASATYDQIQNSATIAWGVGNVTEVFNNDSGTITDAFGEVLNVYNRAGASIGEVTLSSMYMENTGTITGDGYGLWIGGSSTGSVAGDAYALYISSPFGSAANITGNSYALFSDNASDSYMEGSLGVGTSSPQQKVHISGAMRLEPQATPPAGGALGDLYADTDGNLYFNDGVSWKAVLLGP